MVIDIDGGDILRRRAFTQSRKAIVKWVVNADIEKTRSLPPFAGHGKKTMSGFVVTVRKPNAASLGDASDLVTRSQRTEAFTRLFLNPSWPPPIGQPSVV
jgi:hypothetical protein